MALKSVMLYTSFVNSIVILYVYSFPQRLSLINPVNKAKGKIGLHVILFVEEQMIRMVYCFILRLKVFLFH